MKPRFVLTLAGVGVALVVTACSDPSEQVHRSAGADPELLPTAEITSAEPYVIRAGSTIGFIGSKVTGSHEGGFHRFTGTIQVDNGRIVGTPEVLIDMESTWSDNDRLTAHLKNEDFFDVPNHPISTFRVTRIESEGSREMVTGNLTLRGVTRSISFPATIGVTEEEATVTAEFAINRNDFGVNHPGRADDLIRDNVVIKLDLRATPGPARAEDEHVHR